MIETGKKIDTNFKLKVVQDREEKEVSFSELLDRKTIVSVYMKNNTSSCDRQTLSLAENADWFDKKGFNVIAMSKDGCRSHKNYAKKQGINYTLASDPDYLFAEATDSIVDKQMFGKSFTAPSRSNYIASFVGIVIQRSRTGIAGPF